MFLPPETGSENVPSEGRAGRMIVMLMTRGKHLSIKPLFLSAENAISRPPPFHQGRRSIMPVALQ
jgi:hypothetical protein